MGLGGRSPWFLGLALVLAFVPPTGPRSGSFAEAAMVQDSAWNRCRRERSWWGCFRLLTTGNIERLYGDGGSDLPPPALSICPDGSMPTPDYECPPRFFVPDGRFHVFFDRDSYEIASEMAAALDNVAAYYQGTGGASLLLAGHADRSEEEGSELARYRVSNVRAYLVGRGVPDAAIRTETHGESRPLVDTADGVAEEQNRRVEISFGPPARQP